MINHASLVLNFPDASDETKRASDHRQRREVMGRLKRLQVKVPCHRTINIYMARLHRQMGDVAAAIVVLSEVIQNRATVGLDKNDEETMFNNAEDHAALLYNRACYRTLLASQRRASQGVTDESKRLLTEAWDDLKSGVRLSPQIRDDAKEDSDFDGLVGLDEPSRGNWGLL